MINYILRQLNITYYDIFSTETHNIVTTGVYLYSREVFIKCQIDVNIF